MAKTHLRRRVNPIESDYAYASWYSNAKDFFSPIFGQDYPFFVGLLSATSPRKYVTQNLRHALTIYKHWKIGNMYAMADYIADLMPALAINVLRVLADRPLSGNKVNAYAENLKGNLEVVTVDIWTAIAYGVQDEKLERNGLYERLAKKVRREAKYRNLKPAEWQAVVWSAIRRVNGKNDIDYIESWKRLGLSDATLSSILSL